jgi:hypothetical protein
MKNTEVYIQVHSSILKYTIVIENLLQLYYSYYKNVTENYLACARESVPIVVTGSHWDTLWNNPKKIWVWWTEKLKNYSRLKLNGIEFGFFSGIFSFLSAQPTHMLLFRSHNPISKTKN